MSRPSRTTLPPTLDEMLRAEQRKLSVVQDISRALSSTIELDELLSLMMAKMTELVGADRSTLYLRSEDGTELWSNVQKGGVSHEIRLGMGEGIAGAVALSGETVNIRDAYQDSRFQPSVDKESGYRTKSILCVPMQDTVGRIIGVLQLLNKVGGEHFRTQDEELLEAIASQAAMAVERSTLYQTLIEQNNELMQAQESLQRKTISLNILYDLEQQLSTSQDLDELLPRLLALAVDALGAGSGSIALRDTDTGGLRFRTVLGPVAEFLVGKPIPKGKGVVSWVAANQEAVFVNNPESDPRYAADFVDDVGAQRPKHIACAPLLAEGEVFGVLEVLNKQNGEGFSEQDLQMLTLLAGRVARAIEIARGKAEHQKQERLASIGRMLSGMIHDLKTPMTIISGFAQLMADNNSEEKRTEFVGQIREQFVRMDAMTKEVLAFARGKTNVLIRRVYLHHFFETVATQIGHAFAGKNLELVVAPTFTGVAYFDENAILRLVHNLASNAADEMKGGGVFTVGCHEDSRNGNDYAVFTFTDTGGGIPKELEGRLFETFATGKDHGTGLGLAIVKKIVDNHEGHIEYESSPSGTCFKVWLPRVKPTGAAGGSEQ